MAGQEGNTTYIPRNNFFLYYHAYGGFAIILWRVLNGYQEKEQNVMLCLEFGAAISLCSVMSSQVNHSTPK